MSNTTVLPVTLDGPVVLAQVDPTQRWNGFLAAPALDPHGVVTILDWLTETNEEYAPVWGFLPNGDLQILEGSPFEGYEVEVIPADADGLITLGAFGWVWSESTTTEIGA